MSIFIWLMRIYIVWATFTIMLDLATHDVTTATQIRSGIVSFWVLMIVVGRFIPDDE